LLIRDNWFHQHNATLIPKLIQKYLHEWLNQSMTKNKNYLREKRNNNNNNIAVYQQKQYFFLYSGYI